MRNADRFQTGLSALLLAAVLLGLPLLGVALSGGEIAPYLEFPPATRHVEQPGFSAPVFAGILFAIVVMVGPFLFRAARMALRSDIARPPSSRAGVFPWWGWLGVAGGVSAWTLAWTRFAWMEPLQLYTFPAIWLGYIVVLNALTCRRSGHCMLRDRPRTLLLLFPVSAAFWWFFEYLNRFVQNWYYVVPTELGAVEYTLTASLSFSTVLPAVLGTAEWLKTFRRPRAWFANWVRVRVRRPALFCIVVLIISGLSLSAIGVWPTVLYPFLWLAPLLLITSWQAWRGNRHILSAVAQGDWSDVVAAALAGLVCGFFWEMWNYYSWAKWIYAVPYVQRPELMLFEMPVLGYAGYLPFGLVCLAVGSLVERTIRAKAKSAF